jgi:membrane-associated protein
VELFLDLFLNLDVRLAEIAAQYGVWLYALLFLIVFAETGLVVTPFLPGDSLLFAAGALAATGALDPLTAATVLVAAAILGDAVNYSAGHFIGPRVFTQIGDTGLWSRLLNREHLEKSRQFFEKYGGKAVVMGRFVPIVRTFVPFVAGAASMTYATFAFYNVTGALVWVGVCLGAGFAFGNVPVVKENFSLVTIGIIIVSVAPAVIGYLRERRGATQLGVPDAEN